MPKFYGDSLSPLLFFYCLFCYGDFVPFQLCLTAPKKMGYFSLFFNLICWFLEEDDSVCLPSFPKGFPSPFQQRDEFQRDTKRLFQ